MLEINDIEMTSDGDVSVADNGDLSLAEGPYAILSQVIFLLCTNQGEYRPDRNWGANLGTLIGYPNDETRELLAEEAVIDQLERAGLSDMLKSVQAIAGGNSMMVTTKLSADLFTTTEASEIGISVAFPYLSGDVVYAYSSLS